MTYDQLFVILRRLGFTEQERKSQSTRPSRIYVYVPTNTVLLYRESGDQTVSPADLLSTEMRLQSNGIVNGSLESLLASPESIRR